MGSCTSCDASSAVGESPTTGKLILSDGILREFDRPVLAASLLAGKSPDRRFVCDADEMELDCSVSAVGADELLCPGQIYFVLPTSMLRSPLQTEDLARLAVKANAALTKNAASSGRSSVAPLVFEPKVVAKQMAVPTASGRRRRRRKSRSGSGSGRKFASDLSAIPE